ncbi:SGNH/GDSL hydrolase family protein [Candidatus Omnitrophota bacterium]
MSKIKHYFINTVLFIVPLMLLLSLEVFLRVRDIDFIMPIRVVFSGHSNADFREYHMFTDKDFVVDPYLFWKIKTTTLDNYIHNTNKEIYSKEIQDGIKVFCLGDSLTMGTKEFSYPRKLNNLCATNQPNKEYCSVKNYGVAGYTSLQGYRFLTELIKLKPHIVTICFGWNDACLTARAPDKDFKPHNNVILTVERI